MYIHTILQNCFIYVFYLLNQTSGTQVKSILWEVRKYKSYTLEGSAEGISPLKKYKKTSWSYQCFILIKPASLNFTCQVTGYTLYYRCRYRLKASASRCSRWSGCAMSISDLALWRRFLPYRYATPYSVTT